MLYPASVFDAASFSAELAVLCTVPTYFFPLSLSPHTHTHRVMHTHKLCLSLPLALRQGFDGSIVTVLGSEHSDGEEEREMATGGKKGWYEGEDR